MNIMVVSAMFPPIRTGTSFYAQNLSRALAARGHAVTVVTLETAEPVDDSAPFEVVRVPAIHLGIPGFFKHWRMASVYPGNYRSLSRLVRTRKPDMVLVINQYLDLAFPALHAARRHRVRTAISIGTQIQSASPMLHRALRQLDRLICGRGVLPYCDSIVCWDREIERYVNDTHGARFASVCTVVPFGVSDETLAAGGKPHDYGYRGIMVGVGAVISQRDYMHQVRVLHILKDRYPELRLFVVGHVYTASAVQLARKLGLDDRVSFLGELPQQDVLALLDQADLHWMMLNAAYRGLGTSNLEAMALGVPVVSNVPPNLFDGQPLADTREYVRVDGQNVEADATAVGKLLDSENYRRTVGTLGQQFVRTQLSWDAIAARLEERLGLVGSAQSSELAVLAG